MTSKCLHVEAVKIPVVKGEYIGNGPPLDFLPRIQTMDSKAYKKL